jgi:hypothetical protein
MNDYRIVDKNTPGTIDGFNFDLLKKQHASYGNIRLCAAGGCAVGTRSLYNGHWYHVAVAFSSKEVR